MNKDILGFIILVLIMLSPLIIICVKHLPIFKYLQLEGIGLTAEEIIKLSKAGYVSPSFEHYCWDWEGLEPTYLKIEYKDPNEVNFHYQIKPLTFRDYKKVVDYIYDTHYKQKCTGRKDAVMHIERTLHEIKYKR